MGQNHALKRLYKSFGGQCHYCGKNCNRRQMDPDAATIEHVVPRFFGGPNHYSNYVLACSACNQERGSQLFFCECYFCLPLINSYVASDGNVRAQFDAMIAYNKPRVSRMRGRLKDGRENMWRVRMGCNARVFESFEEAMEFALAGWPIKRPKERNEVNDSERNLG